MKLTLAITVYNRWKFLLESFANVIDDDRIDEILIMDDCSADEYWKKIQGLPKFNPKIKVVRQLQNRGMSVNKRDAIFNSKNEWVIIFDSDNVIGKDYLDALGKHSLTGHQSSIIFCPDFARPNFDYRKYKDEFWGAQSIKGFLCQTEMSCFLNTCNYVVNRERYLQVWQENKEVISSDTIWFNYLWLKSNGCFIVTEGMNYHHRVHSGSGFLQDVDYNMKKAEEIKKLIQSL
jgi:glycosyltransferase involved in cell wall biosynthesis